MTEILTAAEMRGVEQRAIADGCATGLELMERAGRGVLNGIFSHWPNLAAQSGSAIILAGPGNNGGDGYVVARLLSDWGWSVRVLSFGDPARLPADARQNWHRWTAMGCIDALEVADPDGLDATFFKADLIVDALFGTGLSRGLSASPALFHALQRVRRANGHAKVVAVDLPSGLCSDSGRVLASGAGVKGQVARADLTVTFHRWKLGHVLADGPEFCGEVALVDLGLRADASFSGATTVGIRLDRLDKRPSDHKFSHGAALIITGGAGKTGAARLAGRAALRVGAGVVSLGVPPGAEAEVANQITALMMTPLADSDDLLALMDDPRLSALCMGPGLGLGTAQRDLVAAGLRGCASDDGPSLVLDADALTHLARDAALFSALSPGCVLTPHAGEFARLFPDLADKLRANALTGPAYSKVDATRQAAARCGAVVVFKGPDTVIATPGGRCWLAAAVYDAQAPWLATAGSGDVLAGLITGLLARGFSPQDSAQTAVMLQLAAARRFGPGLIAEDLPEQIPAVLRDLLA
jgi:hydroxyethylthiazole kinase-like uncharacterized protein yjeF